MPRISVANAPLWERAEPVLRRRLAPKTFAYYKDGWNLRVLPTFGKMKVGAISVGDVERAQAEWTRDSSIHTARQARYALSAVLRVAVRDRLVWGPPKGGRSRLVPIPQHLTADLLDLARDQRRDAQVFRSERTQDVIRGNVLKKRTDWKKLVAGLGFADFRIHDLRATAATNFLSANVPPHVARDTLGHTDLRVTNGYARPHDDALTLAAATLTAYSAR